MEARGNESKEFMSRISGTQVKADSPGIVNDDGSDTDEFIADTCTCGMGHPRVFQGGAPDVVEEYIGE